MDARGHHTSMSFNNNGFVEEEPIFYPPGAYGSETPSWAPTVRDRRIMDPVEFEVNEMSFIGSSAAQVRHADQQRVRNNQNREQGNGLIENLRRYVGENMLNLNGNQDEDGQERGIPPNIYKYIQYTLVIVYNTHIHNI